MASSRALELMRELMQEVGITGTVLPAQDGGLEAQLSLDVSGVPIEILQDIFMDTPAPPPVPAAKKRKAEKALHEEDCDPEDEEVPAPAGEIIDEEELMKMFREKSGRECYKLRPDIFTSKGKFKKEYVYIAAGEKKPKLGGPGGSNGRITNRPWVKVIELNGHNLQCGFVETTNEPYARLVLVFPRASGAAPTYGLQGMFERGAVAGRAFAALERDDPAMIISIPRAQVASKWPMSNTSKEEGAKLIEMIQTLDAAPDNMRVDLVSIGIDGLTTDLESFRWLHERWGPRLRVRLVFIVPSHFPGTKIAFPILRNGIRYGIFELDNVASTISGSLSATPECQELVQIIQMIRDNKEDREVGYKNLTAWTVGRANFRVCPSSKYDSGVDEDAHRRSRTLREEVTKSTTKFEQSIADLK